MAELTATLETRLRRRIGVGAAGGADEVFTTAELTDIFENEASGLQSTDALIFQQAVVICFEELLADSAKQVNYKEHHSTENLSDVSKHLKELLKYHLGKLYDMETTAGGGAIKFGKLKVRQTRIKDIPDA